MKEFGAYLEIAAEEKMKRGNDRPGGPFVPCDWNREPSR